MTPDLTARAKRLETQRAAAFDDVWHQMRCTAYGLEATLRSVAGGFGVGAGKIIHPVRLALSGMAIGPGLYELMLVLGKETVLRRLRRAVEILG